MTEQINIKKSTNLVTTVRCPAFLQRAFVITWESAIVAVLAVMTLVSRLWLLGARVMSHDESLHVY